MRLWPSLYFAEELDRQISPSDHIEAFQPQMYGWVKAVRYALGVAAVDLAKRLGVSQAAVTQLEQRESTGAISVAKLESIADALDCDLIYGFVPRSSFAEMAREIQQQQDAARKAKRKIPRPV